MTREAREGEGNRERVGKPGGYGERPILRERFFRSVVFFSFFFWTTKENRVAVPFRRKQILSHTCYLQ